jgi:hypothetical protein
MAPIIALMALAALGLSMDPFHEPFHARGLAHAVLSTLRNVTEALALRLPGTPHSAHTVVT